MRHSRETSAELAIFDASFSPGISYDVISKVIPYLDFDTCKSLRLCSRDMDRFVCAAKPPTFPAVYRFPRELIQQVFDLLAPSDFDAARHTCHAWMMASLNRIILQKMLKRGGWWSGAVTESESSGVVGLLNNEWYLSRKLAREVALGPAWQPSAITETCQTDFTELASGDSSVNCKHGCGLGFTVSVCGNFVLIAEGCVIYVYELAGSVLRPVTSVVCPRRVLATSMDTSANRFSLAALLDSRMGIVCDLEYNGAQREMPSPRIYSDHSLSSHYGAYGASSIPTHDINGDSSDVAAHVNDDHTTNPAHHDMRESDRISSIHIRSPHQSVSLYNASEESERLAVNQTWRNTVTAFSQLAPTFNNACHDEIPISLAPLSIYHSLCSPDDPPRSVAICPSRRCLAFGCAAGIELHWIDALSGRNLMKWFPLTAPSDFLYFLPTRRGIDSPNKLRLISSKAGPQQRAGIDRHGRKAPGKRRYGMSWGNLRFDRGVGSRETDYDHYAAVPISDGSHILFTDPQTGLLRLGSDAPLGGPTKLLRKMTLIPPPGVRASKEEPPSIYAAGTDLTWGVRIVAVYGEAIVMFSVPPDVFNDIKKITGTALAPAHEDGEEYQFGPWTEWWDYGAPAVSTAGSQMCRWPVPLKGTVVARMSGVVDIAVQSSEIAIWAFSVDGTSHTWQMGGTDSEHVQRVVERNGAVFNVGRDGDWVMKDKWT